MVLEEEEEEEAEIDEYPEQGCQTVVVVAIYFRLLLLLDNGGGGKRKSVIRETKGGETDTTKGRRCLPQPSMGEKKRKPATCHYPKKGGKYAFPFHKSIPLPFPLSSKKSVLMVPCLEKGGFFVCLLGGDRRRVRGLNTHGKPFAALPT